MARTHAFTSDGPLDLSLIDPVRPRTAVSPRFAQMLKDWCATGVDHGDEAGKQATTGAIYYDARDVSITVSAEELRRIGAPCRDEQGMTVAAAVSDATSTIVMLDQNAKVVAYKEDNDE